jgi:hypothetical protein
LSSMMTWIFLVLSHPLNPSSYRGYLWVNAIAQAVELSANHLRYHLRTIAKRQAQYAQARE